MSYQDYSVTLTYTIPWMNNTQVGDIAFDGAKQKLKYAFRNATYDYCDYTVNTADTYKYGRTVKDHHQCIYQNLSWADTYYTFIPNMEEEESGKYIWNEMEETYLGGQKVRHFRYNGDYIEEQQDGWNFTDVRSYQQDFYCVYDSIYDTYAPVKWYMQSKSNMQSHYDIYQIEYQDFIPSTTYADFNFIGWTDMTCPEDPTDPDQPVGPTRVLPFKSMQIRKSKPMSKQVKINMDKINQWRANKNFTFKVMPNQYIDYDIKEFLRSRGGKVAAKPVQDIYDESYWLQEPYIEDLPKSLDWRVKGVMTYAKDQLFCGSCWTFSAIGCLESAINIKRKEANSTEPLITLSEQQVVDCFWVFESGDDNDGFATSMGCEGGDEDDVLRNWALEGHSSFATEHDYPYLGQDDWCKNETLATFTDYKVTKWHRVPLNDIVQMKRALTHGPVAIGVAVPESFVYYAGGVYNDPECGSAYTDIGHAVLAVGWGENEYGQYWIVRNSWSPLWGQDGYIYISMKDNLCGVLTLGSWIEVEKNE